MTPKIFQIIVLFLFVCFTQTATAQFNLKKLKKSLDDSGLKKTIEEATGKELNSDILFKKIQDAYAKEDTASFNFALSSIDNVSFYEDQNNFKEFLGGVGFADGMINWFLVVTTLLKKNF
ncbi:MAG: hypothetical protein O2951_10270 [Bacteroidetes bacterium]|nr:hypothetical protein [Bacteroidota bacterium]